MLELRKSVMRREVLRPPDFRPDIHLIELRQDPLTGRRSRLNAKRAGRVKRRDAGPIPAEVIGSEADCPFCPQNIDRSVTVFEPGFCPAGKIEVGECRLFPNMYPLARHHAAATVCQAHFLDLDEFTPAMVADCLAAAVEFLSLVRRRDPDSAFPMFHWNHLPPSAASVVHPHVQVLADGGPTSYQQKLLEASREYFEANGRSFWDDFLKDERDSGERYIGENGSVAAVASFAPQGNREIQIIFKDAGSLADLSGEDIAGFAGCITSLLKAYRTAGVNSFNLSSFSGPAGRTPPYYALHAKLISRPVLQPYYRNDTGILERFHQEADIETMPEPFAESIRQCWERECP